MKLIIDDADTKKIAEILKYYPVDGVTTNPTILSKSGKNPYDVLGEIREMIGPDRELHAQVVSKDADGMVREGRKIVERLGENTYVKVPSVQEGFRAMRILSGEGIKVTGTAVYMPMQAFLAAKSGARYAAPYVNRIDNLGNDGVKTAKTIHDIFRVNGLQTEVLAASFKNAQQLLELVKYGIGAATVSADIILSLINNPNVDNAVAQFTADFEGLVGKGKTMENC